MRLVQFIKWWWSKNDYFNRTLACFFFFCIIPALISIAWLGKNAFLVALTGAAITAVGWALYGIFYWLRSMWREFDNELPTEDVKIIRRLKGVTPAREEYCD